LFLHSYCFKKLDRQTLAVFNDVPLLFNISADWLLCFEQRNSGTWDKILDWRQANGVHIANSMYSTAVPELRTSCRRIPKPSQSRCRFNDFTYFLFVA
jgi:hypothetical protein